jgi:hypothetical protein
MDGSSAAEESKQYAFSAPPEELAARIPQIETSWREALNRHQLPRAWYLIWCQTYGVDPRTSHQTGVQYIGPELDALRFRTNLTRPNVRQSIMLALGERPKFQGVASNNDVASLAQVPAVNKLIDYAMREARIDQFGYEATEADRYFGKGYLWLTWDVTGGEMVDGMVVAKDEDDKPLFWTNEETGEDEPMLQPGKLKSGALRIEQLYPWQVVCESFTKDPSWYIVKVPVSKHELAAQYPELADEIMSIDNFNSDLDRELFAFSADVATTDLVIVRHTYHKACPAVPNGRHTITLEQLNLEDNPSPIEDGMPVIPMCTMHYFGTSLGYPEVSDLVAQQEVLDDVTSQVVNNLMKFGNQSLWAEAGVDFDKDQIAEGGGFFTLGANQKPPAAIQWAAMPEIAKFLLEYMPGVMNQIAGLNATALGKPEGNVDSGQAMALMVNVAERYQHATQAAYDRMLYVAANQSLEFIRTNAENGYAIQVAGAGNLPYMHYFKQEQLQSVRRVQIVRANPLMATFPVRLEVFNATRDLPKDQKRQAYEMLMTGDLTAITEDDDTQTFLIRYENEQLLEGGLVEAMVDDDHRIHNLSHRTTRDKLRAVPPSKDEVIEQKRIQAILTINQHMLQHAQLWLQLDPTLGASVGVPPAQAAPGGGMLEKLMPQGPAPKGKGGGKGAPANDAPPHPKKDVPQLPKPAQQPPEANLRPGA